MTGVPPRAGRGVGADASSFRPWVVVAAAATTLMFGGGLSFYAFPVYMNELVRRDPDSLAAVSNAVSAFYFAFAFAGIPVASLIRRVDTRWVIAVGSLVCGAGLGSVALATRPWHLALAFALVGVGSSATTVLPSTTVIVGLFEEQRAKALALTMTGFSVGGVAVAPVVSVVVHAHGIAACAPWLAVAYVVLVGGPGSVFVSSKAIPAAVQRPSATTQTPPEVDCVPVVDVPYRQAVRSWTFVVLAGTCAVLLGNQMGPQVHIVRLGAERGVASPVLLITVIAMSSLVGRLVGGLVMSRVPTTDFLAGLGMLQAVALGLLAAPSGSVGAVLGASLFGVCIGNLGVVMPLLLVERFGLSDYSRIFGLHQFVVNLGMAVGPGLLGWMRSQAGRYPLPILVLAAGSVGSALLIQLVLRPSHPRQP